MQQRVVIAFGLTVVCGAAAQQRPAALERLFAKRAALETAVVELSYENRIHPFASPISYTAQLANSDAIVVNWGDKDGLVGLGESARADPRRTLRTSEFTLAYSDEGYGNHFLRSGVGDDAREGVLAIRSIGVSLGLSWGPDIDEVLFREPRKQATPRVYSETREGELIVVRAENETGALIWWIDPAKDYSPTRVTYESDGRIWRDVHVELAQFDGVWFPRRVEYVTDGEVTEVLEITGAEFNRPEHPRRLTPADIGIEPGFWAEDLLAQPGDPVMVWDGEGFITSDEYTRRVVALRSAGGSGAPPAATATGDAAPASTDDTRRATGDAEKPARPRSELADLPASARRLFSEWERYTAEFIASHALDPTQTERAWRTLADCQDQALRYIRARRADMETAERELASEPDAKGHDDRRDRATKRLRVLTQPVEMIFEHRLKPGLTRILTKEQREKASAQTTQPASGSEPKP